MQHLQRAARPSRLLPLTRWLCSCSSTTNTNTTLFVGGLSFDTNEPILKDAFESHGEIIEGILLNSKVICHHVNGRSQGYGFVNFTSETAAAAALKAMDGKLLDGRNIRVEYARGRRER